MFRWTKDPPFRRSAGLSYVSMLWAASGMLQRRWKIGGATGGSQRESASKY